MRAKVMNAQATKAHFSCLIHVWNPPLREKLHHNMGEDHGCFTVLFFSFPHASTLNKGQVKKALVTKARRPDTRTSD